MISAPTARSSNIVDSYPLSPMQQGMAFNSLLSPNAGVDIEQIVITLEEVCDLLLLRQAWERIVERYDVLRTSFEWQAAEPLQMVHAHVELPWKEEGGR